jgi:hypothetical protein
VQYDNWSRGQFIRRALGRTIIIWRVKMKIKLFHLIIFSCVLISFSCEPHDEVVVSSGNDNHLYYSNNSLGVYFNDTITYKFITSFFNDLNLKAIYIIADSNFQMEVQVDSGYFIDYVTTLSKAPSVFRVDSIAQVTGKLIVVNFRGNYSISSSLYAKNLIIPLHGLTFKQFIVHRFAQILLPDNNLQKWMDILGSYPFVTKVILPACGSC